MEFLLSPSVDFVRAGCGGLVKFPFPELTRHIFTFFGFLFWLRDSANDWGLLLLESGGQTDEISKRFYIWSGWLVHNGVLSRLCVYKIYKFVCLLIFHGLTSLKVKKCCT